jgi:large subunit ribosomal protein L21
MYAVIVRGGKQYRVKAGQIIKVEKLEVQEGGSIKFDNILMVTQDGKSKLGAPYISGYSVSGSVISHGRGEKIRIIKMKRRKHHMKRMGHRQSYTEVKIDSIHAA